MPFDILTIRVRPDRRVSTDLGGFQHPDKVDQGHENGEHAVVGHQLLAAASLASVSSRPSAASV